MLPSDMKLFLDSGNIDQIQSVMKILDIKGITTNPKLSTTQDALQLAYTFKIPTSIQIDYLDKQSAITEAKKVETPWSIIKIPISDLEIGKKLIESGMKVNFTLCFDLYQVICASNLGAEYVSIFVGRLIDAEKDARGLLIESVKYLANTNSKTKIIAASIRSIRQLEMIASTGCHIATVPTSLLLGYKNPFTEAGLEDFEKNKIG